MKHPIELVARRMKTMGLRPLNCYGLRRLAIVALAISPPFFCAFLAEGTGRWDLFERAGSTTAAVGLLVASRRYIGHGVLELTMLQVNNALKSNIAEVQEDIVTDKFGLALSAFGTVIWGWGAYLGWWSFGCLGIWALFAIRDARQDLQSKRAPEVNIDDPAYLRSQSRRLRNILRALSDPDAQKELASHSLYLAQRAEAISRTAEKPAIERTSMSRQPSALSSEVASRVPGRAEQTLSASEALCELAAWYRSFAEQAGDHTIRQARLRSAEDLEIEAERMACRKGRVDPGHGTQASADGSSGTLG